MSRETEQAILGGLLIDANAIDRCGDLRAEHFSDGEHKAIFNRIWSMISRGDAVDPITVFDGIKGRNPALIGYLTELHNASTGTANIGRYAQSLRDRAIERDLAGMAGRLQDVVSSRVPVAEKLAQAQAMLDAISQTVVRKEPVDWSTAYAGYSVAVEARMDGKGARVIPTGLHGIDRVLNGGLRVGQVALLGARPGMGKTALAQCIAEHVSRDRSVLFLSMEMSSDDLNDRWTAMLSDGDLSAITAADSGLDSQGRSVIDLMMTTAVRINGRHLSIDDQSSLTAVDVRLKAQGVKRRSGLDLIVIDYLQLMEAPELRRDTRNTQLESISRAMKSLAKDLKVAILALVQVGRDVEKRADGWPNMSDIRDCGAIEQDADVIMFLDRPVARDPELDGEWATYSRIRVAKNRQGEKRDIPLFFNGSRQKFGDWNGQPPMRKVVNAKSARFPT